MRFVVATKSWSKEDMVGDTEIKKGEEERDERLCLPLMNSIIKDLEFTCLSRICLVES